MARQQTKTIGGPLFGTRYERLEAVACLLVAGASLLGAGFGLLGKGQRAMSDDTQALPRS